MAFLPIPYDPPGAPPPLLTAPSWTTKAFQRASFNPIVPVSCTLRQGMSRCPTTDKALVWTSAMSGLASSLALSRHAWRCLDREAAPIRPRFTLVSVNVTVTGSESPSCRASRAFRANSRTSFGMEHR